MNEWKKKRKIGRNRWKEVRKVASYVIVLHILSYLFLIIILVCCPHFKDEETGVTRVSHGDITGIEPWQVGFTSLSSAAYKTDNE